MCPFETYRAGGVNARPLHGDGDAVEEDNNQHNMVEQLVGDNLIADDPKPDKEHREMWNLVESKINLAIIIKTMMTHISRGAYQGEIWIFE